MRHLNSLRNLFLLTPTQEEMDALSGTSVEQFMGGRNIENLLVTRGQEGLTLYDAEGRVDLAPRVAVEAPDTTGAGDLLLASIVSGLQAGQPIRVAVRAAMTAVEQRLQNGEPL